jgi:hypothetical protein
MEVACSSKTLVFTTKSTWCYNPEEKLNVSEIRSFHGGEDVDRGLLGHKASGLVGGYQHFGVMYCTPVSSEM